MGKIKTIVFIVSQLIISNLLNAQTSSFQPNFINFSVENGLPSNETYCIYQDKQGYIWIGTDRGLSKYDGYEFKTYTVEDGLPDNVIFDIQEDDFGRMWFTTLNNSIVYKENDQFKGQELDSIWSEYRLLNQKEYLVVNDIYVDSNTITISTFNNHKFRINLDNHQITHLVLYDKTPSSLYLSESSSSLQYEVIPQNNKNPNKTPKIYYNDSLIYEIDLGSFFTSRVRSYESIDLQLYSFKNHLIIKKGESFQLQKFQNRINMVYYDQSSIWVGIDKKLYKDGNLFKPLRNKTVTGILKDKQGGYWFTTLESGIYYCPDFKQQTLTYPIEGDWINDLEKNSSGQIFGLSRNGHLYRLNENTLQLKDQKSRALKLKYNKEVGRFITDAGDLYDETGKYISKALVSRTHFFYNDTLLSIHQNYNNLIDTNGNLLEKRPTNSFRNKRFFCHLNSNDTIWLGGLKSFTRLVYPDDLTIISNEHKLLQNRINSIYKKNNIIWLSTLGKGIITYDTKKQTITNITQKDGLISNNINQVIHDNNNVVWVATNKGINYRKANDINSNISLLSTSNGLVSNEIFDLLIKEDTLYISSRKGISKLNVNDFLSPENIDADIHITGLKANNEKQNITNSIHVSYDLNNIEFEYISLQYNNSGNITYRYRIAEIDTNWYQTKSRTARFPNLEHGEYTFEVASLNESGIWSKSKSVSFVITPALWQTLWFKIAIVLLILVILLSVLYFRYRNKAIQKELQANIERYRYQALTSQMNPHFVFNALNSIQFFILDKNRRAASKYLSTFAKLIRASFENSKHELIPFEDEIDALKLYVSLENLRLENKVEVNYDIDDSIDSMYVKVPPLIVQPFVENAFLHGLAPKKGDSLQLTIQIKSHDEHVYIKIEDNGIGRKASSELKKAKNLRKKKSSGVSISEDRIKAITRLEKQNQLGYKFTITDKYDLNQQPSGTIVEMLIPKLSNQN